MRVEYQVPINVKIRKVIEDATAKNQKIECIRLTDAEWDEVMNYLSQMAGTTYTSLSELANPPATYTSLSELANRRRERMCGRRVRMEQHWTLFGVRIELEGLRD